MDRNKDMKLNGSGYYDETAYKAYQSMRKPGEIWVRNTDKKQVLVLAVHHRFCTVLPLSDHMDAYGEKIAVNGSGTQYAHPGKIMYMYHDLFGSYVRKMAYKDFLGVLDAVGKALAIPYRKEGGRT
jgi:hypothetical protein